jgi:hypothetical protein
MSDQPDDTHTIIQEYQKKFGDVPTLIGLGEDDYLMAIGALEDALEAGRPWKSDEEFRAALGLEMPPDDAVI